MTAFVASALIGFAALMLGATLVGAWLARAGFPAARHDGAVGHIGGLRGYLALAVMAHHFVFWLQIARFDAPWRPPVSPFLNQLGVGGVALFFMITGCLFWPVVARGIRAPGWRGWAALVVKRVFRIQPLLIVSVAACAVVVGVREGRLPDADTARAIVMWCSTLGQPALFGDNLAWMTDAGVLWSLRYEWAFYLMLLPGCALIRDLLPGAVRSALPAMLVTASVAARWFVHGHPIVAYLPLFAIGMVARQVHGSVRARRWLSTRAAGVVAVACLLAAMTLFRTPYALVPLLLYAACFVIVAGGNDLFGVLSTRAALALGECSFSIYLLHGIALSLMFVEGGAVVDAMPPDALPVLLPLVGMAVVAVAAGAFLAIERPALRWGGRIARAITHRAVRVASERDLAAP